MIYCRASDCTNMHSQFERKEEKHKLVEHLSRNLLIVGSSVFCMNFIRNLHMKHILQKIKKRRIERETPVTSHLFEE